MQNVYERILKSIQQTLHGRPHDLLSALSGGVRRSVLAGAALLLPLAILTGCGVGAVDTTQHVSIAMHGVVHGGQQPVSGSTIQIYSAGVGGNASAAKPLIPSGEYYLGGQTGCVPATSTCYTSVLTDGSGGFNINNDYTCNPTDQVYITATGGNPGLAAGTNNNALVMVAALGSCLNLSGTDVYIDEVTTVAAAWALAPFANSATLIGSSATNTAGIANAFLDAQLLANTATGMAATLATNLTIESGKLYALADVLAACVNSDGTAGCSSLLTAAKPSNGSKPADTFTAALDIVHNPGQNPKGVFQAFSAVSAPFATTLKTWPNDWTMSVTITGGGLFTPQALAIDGSNNVWVTGQAGPLSEFSAQGKPYSSTGFGATTDWIEQASGIAIDSNGNVWIADYSAPDYNNNGALTEFDGSTAGKYAGNVVVGNDNPLYTDSSLKNPGALSANTNGRIFIANNFSSSATVYSSTAAGNGALLSSSLGINIGLNATPEAIAADNSNGFWLSDDDNTIAHVDQNGNLLAHPNCCDESYGLALDSAGNVWVASYLSNSFSEVSSSGSVSINQSAVGGLYRPAQVAIDAAQNVWFSNFYNNSISEIAGINGATVGAAISPTNGINGTGGYGLDAHLQNPYSVAPDTAGNLWVSNEGVAAVTMFFGLATPTVTPIMPTPTAP